MLQGGPRKSLALLLAILALAGCFGASQEPADPAADAAPENPFEDVRWSASGAFSKPLAKGSLKALPAEVLTFDSFDGTRLQAAVWRPDTTQPVPVILDVGPYWGDTIGDIGAYFEKQFFVDGLLPHGYAYGRVAVRGTAGSGGCMEFFSENEQQDMDSIVTFFGTQPWSNGNVALFGGSYDGTTPWMAAMFGNPHLKAIVPISGLTSIYDHAFPNGTAWFAGPAFHANYWADGFTPLARGPEDKLANALCPEAARGLAVGIHTTLTGDPESPGPFAGYWEERDFRQRIMDNYHGAVWLVHGMQDWRVPPHVAFPFVQELQDQGVDVRMLLGQWWHDYPDRVARGDNARLDWAERLLRWLDVHLKGEPDRGIGPRVDVEDSHGNWRTEATWPPKDAAWTTFHLGDGGLGLEPSAAGQQVLVGPANVAGVPQDAADKALPVPGEYRASLGKLAKDLRVAGAPRLHATFVPTSPEGARLYAELIEVDGAGAERVVAHAVMDLRYHEGGYERHSLTPGAPVVARMQFFPADVHVPAGHELALRIVNGNGYVPQRMAYALNTGVIDNTLEHPTPLPVVLQWGDGASVLELPLVERDVGDGRYAGQP